MKNFSRMFLMTCLLVAAVGCRYEVEASADAKNAQAREQTMERATYSVPVPNINNFLTRQYLADWMKRLDDPSKVFYVYLMSDVGTYIGYYIGTRPVSVCTYMTPTQKLWRGDFNQYGREALGVAPGLDGVYYGAGGNCDTYFMFDSETGALIHFSGFHYFTSDQPLSVDAEPLRVEASK